MIQGFLLQTLFTLLLHIPVILWNHLGPLCLVNFCIVVFIFAFVGLLFKKKTSQIDTLLELLAFPNPVFTVPLGRLYYHLFLVLETP